MEASEAGAGVGALAALAMETPVKRQRATIAATIARGLV